jgi:DNA-binding response OmpR family regulator
MKENQEILLVDDDRVTRAAYSSVFRSEGYQVRLAKNGVEGVASFLERRPDIVILDVMMPRMNGFEACRLIRIEKKTNPDILLAKIRAALRRKQLAERVAASTGKVCLGSVVVDLADRSVSVSNKLSCRLTRTENDILRAHIRLDKALNEDDRRKENTWRTMTPSGRTSPTRTPGIHTRSF